MKGPVDTVPQGVAEESLVNNPFSRLEEAFDKKRRNLEKRKIRLQQYEEDERNGKQLSEEQQEAKCRIGEVDSQLEYVKDLIKTLSVQRKDYNRANKQRDETNRKKTLTQERQLLTNFFKFQVGYKMLESKHIIEAVTKQLSSEEMKSLNKLRPLFHPVLSIEVTTDNWLPDFEKSASLLTAVLMGTREKVLETLNGAQAKDLLEKVCKMKEVQDLWYDLNKTEKEESSELKVTLTDFTDFTTSTSNTDVDKTSADTAVSETLMHDPSYMYSDENMKRKPTTESEEETEPKPEPQPETEPEPQPGSEPIKKDPKVVFVRSETDVLTCALKSSTEFGYESHTVVEPVDVAPVKEEGEKPEVVVLGPPLPIELPYGLTLDYESQGTRGYSGKPGEPPVFWYPSFSDDENAETKAETATVPKETKESEEQHPLRGQRGAIRRGRGRGGFKPRNGAPPKGETGTENVPAYFPRGVRGGRDFGGRRREPRGYRGGRGAPRGTAAGYGATANGYANNGYGNQANNGYSSYDHATAHAPRQSGFNFANDRRM